MAHDEYEHMHFGFCADFKRAQPASRPEIREKSDFRMTRESSNEKIIRYQEAMEGFKRTDEINMSQLAKIYGADIRRVSRVVRDDDKFPVAFKGGPGVDWRFKAHAALRHLIKREQAKIEADAAKVKRLALISGLPDVGDSGVSLTDLKTAAGIAAENQRRKIDQGRYVTREEHERVVADIFVTVQTELTGARSNMDAAGRWPPEIATEVDEFHRGLLVTMHEKIGKVLEAGERRSPSAGGRTLHAGA